MKASVIFAVAKSGKTPNMISSHRCVAVGPNIFRIFEYLILPLLENFLYANQVIPRQQYGFRKNSRLENIHIDIQKIIYRTYDNRNYISTDIIFFDLSNAFDSINHSNLFHKLKLYGISGQIFDMLKECLTDRKQKVKFDGIFSELIEVKSGVPQGGVLSPLLFNVYIADIVKSVKNNIFCYADDICLVSPIYESNDCVQLQNDINNLVKYFNNSNLIINQTKCKVLRITNKRITHFDYYLNESLIEQVSEAKHIGVIYDRKMTFNSHIEHIFGKALRKFFMIRFLSKNIDGITIVKLFKTYVLPTIEYLRLCCYLTKTQSDKIEKIQRRVTKFICAKMGLLDFPYDDRLKILKLDSLENRRSIFNLNFLWNALLASRPTPCPLDPRIILLETGDGPKLFRTPHRLKLFEKFLLIECMNIFNDMPLNVREANNYKEFIFNVKQYLNIY